MTSNTIRATSEAILWTEESLRSYLGGLGQGPVRDLRITDLAAPEASGLKAYGYGHPLLLEFSDRGGRQRLVLHTLSGDAFGHDRPSDRAESLLLAHHDFNRLPRHVSSLDVGALGPDGALVSLGRCGEFFLLTEFAPGELYARDLERIRDTGRCETQDRERARALAIYLADIHRRRLDSPALYHRRIRDLVGHGEGIMGLTDSYPDELPWCRPGFLKRMEHAIIDWRFRLRSRAGRLAQVHGDFHPFNIVFEDGTQFRLLDRSRGEWGEPADDVTALSINYLFFSLQATETLAGELGHLFGLFWDTYLDASGDREALEAAPPFFAWRSLVLASPLWYASVSDAVRRKLFRFMENVLADTRFSPDRVRQYLE
jgi:hypothetical protein